jgi:hypothetical protein
MKTYSDALLSISASTRLAITPANIVTLVLLLFIFKIDQAASLYLGNLLGVDHRLAYWMLYLFYYVLAITLNMIVILKHLSGCSLDPKDFDRILAHMRQPKQMKDLISGKTISKKTPTWLFFIFGAMVLFGLWAALDNALLSPASKAFSEDKNGYFYHFTQSTIYGIGILAIAAPYLYVMSAIALRKIVFLITMK